jgi:hypothetical protein
MKRPSLLFACECAGGLAAGLAFHVAHAGAFRLELFGLGLGVRGAVRPMLLALAFLALRIWVGRRSDADARAPRRLASALPASRMICGALIVAGAVGWWHFLSATCGGADSYGYVSAADRILAGRLVESEPLATVLPFPDGLAAATPLGYVGSGRVANASVPAYPLGLPALMAIFRAAIGPIGPFVVAPIAAVVLVAAAFAIARTWYGDLETSWLATALVAVNPVVFTYAIQPMSDVPAAAASLVAVAALTPINPWPIAGGIAGAVALLIRPALAPFVAALVLVPMLVGGVRSWRVSARYAAVIGAAIVLQGWTQSYLYGDALASGYGSIAALFSVERAAFNARSYAYWGVRALGPAWVGAMLVGLASSPRMPRWTFALACGAIGLPYLFYRPYDHWETLRFLLPAIVIGTIVAASGLIDTARRFAGANLGPLVAALVAVAIAASSVSWLRSYQVFTMPAHEARHRLAADLVAETTPENAVVLALQHTGNIRYYAHRQTVNWDRIPSGSFDAAVSALRAHRFPVYLMLDSEEERVMFEARHGHVVDTEGWLPNGQRRNVQLFEAPR